MRSSLARTPAVPPRHRGLARHDLDSRSSVSRLHSRQRHRSTDDQESVGCCLSRCLHHNWSACQPVCIHLLHISSPHSPATTVPSIRSNSPPGPLFCHAPVCMLGFTFASCASSHALRSPEPPSYGGARSSWAVPHSALPCPLARVQRTWLHRQAPSCGASCA
jgi:hypothetical protein